MVEIIKTSFLDETDKARKFVAFKMMFKEKFEKTTNLEIIKKTKEIGHLSLIKQSRLSVMTIDFKSWEIIYNMGKIL